MKFVMEIPISGKTSLYWDTFPSEFLWLLVSLYDFGKPDDLTQNVQGVLSNSKDILCV